MCIATKHQKELILAPVFEKELAVKCSVPISFDTDRFGTFTGEIRRSADALTTLREKCLTGMQILHADLGIASEGSFGPHPNIPFTAIDEEHLILIDLKHSLEIISSTISLETNYDHATLKTEEDLNTFATRALFPSHGVILRYELHGKVSYLKDLRNWKDLNAEFRRMAAGGGNIHAETDMRAMRNPTRLKVIGEAAIELIRKIQSVCPKCSAPGFDISDWIPGLPCRLCHSPTRSTISVRFLCKSCGHYLLKPNPSHKEFEDPMYCDRCNP